MIKNLSRPATIKGFTLVEMMIVAAIIAILAAIATPSYGNYVEKNRLTVAKSMLNSARQSLQVVYLRDGVIPADFTNVPVNPNNSTDYNRYYRVEINGNTLNAIPQNENNYPSKAAMNITTGKTVFSDCKYSNACASMNKIEERK